MKFNKKVKRTNLKNMVAEIAYDLGLNKKIVREVLVVTFKEIALILLIKKSPIMIRRFVKFAVAVKRLKRVKENLDKLKTKMK